MSGFSESAQKFKSKIDFHQTLPWNPFRFHLEKKNLAFADQAFKPSFHLDAKAAGISVGEGLVGSISSPLKTESLTALGYLERAKEVALVGLEVKIKSQNI